MSMITWFGCKMKRPDFKIEEHGDALEASWTTARGMKTGIAIAKSEGRLALVQKAHTAIVIEDAQASALAKSLDKAFAKKQKRARRKAA